jgi:hypothetical protein
VPQVIGLAHEFGGGQFWAERGQAGGVPDASVNRFAEYAAAGAAEQSAVRCGAVLVEVAPQHVGEDGRDGGRRGSCRWVGA